MPMLTDYIVIPEVITKEWLTETLGLLFRVWKHASRTHDRLHIWQDAELVRERAQAQGVLPQEGLCDSPFCQTLLEDATLPWNCTDCGLTFCEDCYYDCDNRQEADRETSCEFCCPCCNRVPDRGDGNEFLCLDCEGEIYQPREIPELPTAPVAASG